MKKKSFPARFFMALLSLLTLAGASYAVLVFIAGNYGLPPRFFLLRALVKAGMESTSTARAVSPLSIRPDTPFPSLGKPGWQGHGAREDRVLEPVQYNLSGRPVPFSWIRGNEPSASSVSVFRTVAVANVEELFAALRHARPGDIVTLLPGRYHVKKRSIHVSSGGTVKQPVTIRAERLGNVHLEMDTLEGFHINSPYWIFENLDIRGECRDDDDCEHAFHLVGAAHGFVLRNSRIHEFSSPIKVNRLRTADAPRITPDGILLEGNSFYNTRARLTDKPVTFIDVVGADHFIVSNNLIADFQKAGGDHISYGVQIKGNSAHGVLEKNLLICEYATEGGIRVGLSFGGGGTGREYLEEWESYEHSQGIVRNNIVMFCSDAGLYLNKSHDTKVFNNTFYATSGIDVRFPETSALIANNLLSGNIWDRNGGTSVRRNNLIIALQSSHLHPGPGFDDLFIDPAAADFRVKNGKKIGDKGEAAGLVWEDFCGNKRFDIPDIGALEYGGAIPCAPLGTTE